MGAVPDERRVVNVEGPDTSRAWAAPDSEAEPRTAASPAAREYVRQDQAAAVLPPAPVGPMTLSDILDGSYTIIKRRPRAVITAVAVIILPVNLLRAWLQSTAATTSSTESSALDAVYTLASSTPFAITIAIYAINTLALFFLGGVVSSFVAAWYRGHDLSAGDALRASFRRTPAFVAAWALLSPLKALSYAFCFLPLAVTVTLFALTAPAITIEQIGPIAGIKRSTQLIARRFLPSMGIVLLTGLVSTILRFALAAIPLLISGLLPSPADWILAAVGEGAAGLITTTAAVGASTLLYLDLRSRTEALDLELRATAAFDRAG
jgi:hypothetical protein